MKIKFGGYPIDSTVTVWARFLFQIAWVAVAVMVGGAIVDNIYVMCLGGGAFVMLVLVLVGAARYDARKRKTGGSGDEHN